MTNEERFKLLEDMIRRLEQELELTLQQGRLDRELREEKYRALQDHCLALEAKNQELNRRLFKDTQMTEAVVEADPDTHTVKVTLPSAQAAQQAQTLQQLMQAAGVQSGTGYSNQAGIQGPVPIATASGPRCPTCYGIMGFAKISASSSRYQCMNVQCGKVIIT